ncbi:citrate synthase [Chloracidobacterium aggregatum]|uniref:Citrate synthase n=1 Tax=Chloracidobacterium sp. N TaxID=2821540 RepID=A0ABX8B2N7_9BACT|nr:citrate synthase [Chloracidobacterium aggregatum]QUV85718.1 citrate synthase [Chloracidobacterium sp. 2]QUV87878.1 citrate synthase [Chloracidobacterium sp. S]QUV90775.1 citrate synthase [Chloracidobacterium sp. A]QUV93990.1 citrate synthase [Chloracidobacterium sp. N]QUV97183.1 citrate synthase [Chloracidobacterium sp. E]
MAHEDFIKGLEGVLAAQSSICFIDGAAGRLTYRGIDIQDLAENSTFEETAYFLLFGHLPKQSELDAFVGQLQNEREVPTEIYTLLRTLPSTATPMEVLRTATSALSAYDPDGHDNSDAANVRKAVRLIAQMTTLTTAYDRIRRGLEPIKPDPSLSMAESFLYGLTGEKPHPSSARVFDVCLILHADHELNASTFAARVIASTLSDVHAAVTGAIGALAGSLHGGANQRVLEMLLEIGELDKVEAYVDNLFANKKKIMGFGHRVYRTMDPRATVLRKFARQLGEDVGNTKWYEMAERIEQLAFARKKLYPNVDFFSAPVFYTLNIPVDLFTPIFACSRISGWVAHTIEQLRDNRLIRPLALYTGAEKAEYIPMSDR